MNRSLWTTTTTQVHPVKDPWNIPDPALAWYIARPTLENLTAGFESISLTEMDDVALLNRIDTKFVMTAGELMQALSALRQEYWMLAVNGRRLNHYRTLYFDTPDFALYHAHVNERPERYKVRTREYTESHVSFLEVKHRTRKDRTIKERIPTEQPVIWMTPSMKNWLGGVLPLDGRVLEPKLWNTFTRMTLVSKQYCERVTLDIDLGFTTADRFVELEGIAVAEVKVDAGNCNSPFLRQMREQRIRRQGFSKYAIGVAILYDQVKKNAMKPKMLWVEKLMAKGIEYYE
jgi:hypothetical protein